MWKPNSIYISLHPFLTLETARGNAVSFCKAMTHRNDENIAAQP
jgi:hypothetical protein